MKQVLKKLVVFCILMMLFSLFYSCKKSSYDQPKLVQQDTTITIPPGDVIIACYYFPNWGPVATSEWNTVKFTQPKFKGQGYRRVQVTGFPGTPTVDNFEGLVIHTDVEPVGEFACSNDLVNRIHHAMR